MLIMAIMCKVFVDEAYQDLSCYSTLAILNTSLLHSSAIIDQTFTTRKIMTTALATQFFGCYISTERWSDVWIRKGIPIYLMGLWVRKTFGNNEYRDMVHQHMYDMVKYEEQCGGIILDSSQRPANIVSMRGEATRNPETELNAFCFPVTNLQTCSPEYLEAMDKKAHLVVRMLENRIGQEQLLQVCTSSLL